MLTIDVEAEFDPALLDQAIALLERAVAAAPDKPRYRRALGEAYVARRTFDRGVEHLLECHRVEPEARTAYLLAYSHFRIGDLSAAERWLVHASRRDAIGFSKLHLLRGRILHARGAYADAVNEFARAQVLDPNAARPKWFMARSLVPHAARLEDGVNAWRRALALLREHDPRPEDRDEWHLLLGRVYLALRQPTEALSHLERTQRSARPETGLLVGIAHVLRGDADGARRWLAQAAADAEMRGLCEAFLIEVGCCADAMLDEIPDSLRSRIPALVCDVDLLVGVFGPAAPEPARITAAVRRGHPREHPRTRAEHRDAAAAPPRLFAGFEARRSSYHEDEESTAVSMRRRPRTTRGGDELVPRTELDVTEEVRIPPQEPGRVSKTAPMEIPEDEQNPDEPKDRSP